MGNRRSETNYFKIGLFVLVGIGLIISALLVFGSEKIFQPIVHVETYFEESIQGISEGTPVKYRGLQIGYIEEIAFANEIYGGDRVGSIYVKIAITSKLFTRLNKSQVEKFLSREVSQGLRVRLVTQGLTGISYLEFDYTSSKKGSIPNLNWEPKTFYIPSVTSTLARLSENAQYIMNELKDVDFKKMFKDFNTLLTSFNKAANNIDNVLNQVDNPIIRTTKNLQVITNNLRMVTDRLKLKPSEMIFSSYPPPLDPNKL